MFFHTAPIEILRDSFSIHILIHSTFTRYVHMARGREKRAEPVVFRCCCCCCCFFRFGILCSRFDTSIRQLRLNKTYPNHTNKHSHSISFYLSLCCTHIQIGFVFLRIPCCQREKSEWKNFERSCCFFFHMIFTLTLCLFSLYLDTHVHEPSVWYGWAMYWCVHVASEPECTHTHTRKYTNINTCISVVLCCVWVADILLLLPVVSALY